MTLGKITAMELTLNRIAVPFGGEPHGWDSVELDALK